MTTRSITVTCDKHGGMTRDEPRSAWECLAQGCGAWLPDEEVYRLVAAAPPGGPDPVPIVVT